MYSRNSKSFAAFSLIEVMIGTAVLGLVFLSLPAAYVSLRALNAHTDSMLRASALISGELELLRTHDYETLEGYVGLNNLAADSSVDHPQRKNVQFTVKATLSEGTNELDGMLEAVVEVTWEEDGRSRRLLGRAFFAEDGLSDKKFPDSNA